MSRFGGTLSGHRGVKRLQQSAAFAVTLLTSHFAA